MESCCPSPDYPVIQPDDKARSLRATLYKLYCGQMGICLIKAMLYGGMAGIFQLIHAWVCYSAYATLHFCSCLVYLILCSFDLMFTFMDWQRYEQAMEKDPKKEAHDMVRFLMLVQIAYLVVAIFYTYRAYNHFKILFFVQVGDMRQGQDNSSDEENESAYQQQ